MVRIADLWVDSKPVQGDTNFTTHLTAGKHTVVIRLDGKKLPASFRFVSRDVTFYRDKRQHAQHVVVSTYGAWYFSLLPQRHRTVLTQLGCNTHLPLEIGLEQTP